MSTDPLSRRLAELSTALRDFSNQDGNGHTRKATTALCSVLDDLAEEAAAMERCLSAAIHNTAGPDGDTENIIALAIFLDRRGLRLGMDSNNRGNQR